MFHDDYMIGHSYSDMAISTSLTFGTILFIKIKNKPNYICLLIIFTIYVRTFIVHNMLVWQTT